MTIYNVNKTCKFCTFSKKTKSDCLYCAETTNNIYVEEQQVCSSFKRVFIYLATPFTHKSKNIRMKRYITSCKISGYLLLNHALVFNPLSHSYPIATMVGLPKNWDFWKDLDLKMVSVCDKIIVLRLDEWDKSIGVGAEIAEANRLNKDIEYWEEKYINSIISEL